MPVSQVNLQTIEQAVQFLKAAQLVAFPTETVYGLGADAQSTEAVKKLFTAKGRPADHPVIVHLFDWEQIFDWTSSVPTEAKLLAEHFWPGPLTMILPRSKKAIDLVTGGQDTVGLRIPKHPIALELLKAFGDGLVAPSANKFGHVSPTNAQHVQAEFGSELAMVLDGSNCEVGIESTIVDLSASQPQILRPGMISAGQIAQVLNIKDAQDLYQNKSTVRAPGMLLKHYAPKMPMRLMPISRILSTLKTTEKEKFAVMSFQSAIDSSKLSLWIKASSNPEEYAQDLYANLRKLDQSGASQILIEQTPATSGWLAINDRLFRAENV